MVFARALKFRIYVMRSCSQDNSLLLSIVIVVVDRVVTIVDGRKCAQMLT